MKIPGNIPIPTKITKHVPFLRGTHTIIISIAPVEDLADWHEKYRLKPDIHIDTVGKEETESEYSPAQQQKNNALFLDWYLIRSLQSVAFVDNTYEDPDTFETGKILSEGPFEWTKLDPEDPETFPEIEAELRELSLTVAEIRFLRNEVHSFNDFTSDLVDKAREDFLRLRQQR